MKRVLFPLILYGLFIFFPANAQSPALPGMTVLPEDPTGLLGYTVSRLVAELGAPAKVYAVRGEEAWQDDVVFDYAAGFSFFLYEDHVWQILVSPSYGFPVFGFLPGSAAERIVSMLGSPSSASETMVEWILPAEAWPVRLRGRLGDNGDISELYLYRADF